MSWHEVINQNLGAQPRKVLADSLRVEVIQNKNFYERFQLDLDKVSSPWEFYPLRADVFQLLPSCPGLYMFVWSPNAMCFKTDDSDLKIMRILYVGKSSTSLQERFRSEYRAIIGEANPAYFWKDENESRRVKLRRLFSLEPIELWFCRIHSDEPTLIDNLETRLIALTNPPGNQQRKLKPIGEPQKIWGY